MKSLVSWKTASRLCSHSYRNTLTLRCTSSVQKGEDADELAVDLLGLQEKEKIDPSTTNAVLFPGQGSQYVGMAKKYLRYPNVKEMYECASEILGYNLLDLCLNGPRNKLDETIHCQPAVLVTSLAGVEKLQSETPEVLENCYMTAGYSVGEYAALVFADSLTFEDAVRLVQVRAQEMQKACDKASTGMVSIIGGARTKFNTACNEAVEHCHEHLDVENVVCKVSGYLAPNVRTVAGHLVALEYLQSRKKDYHMKRVQLLPVSGAFHSVLMQPAKKRLHEILANVPISDPIIKVYSNVDGKPYHNAKDIMMKLPPQITKPVHWEQTMHQIYSRGVKENMPNTFECGPGKQLGALLKKCNGKAWANYMPLDVESSDYSNKVDEL